ncbi:MAG: hypothetical protein QXE64_00200 [Candidatus Pacearchaeota archaeon]
MKKREMKKRGIFNIIGQSLKNYFKNLHVALPMLIWLVISAILGLIGLAIFIAANKAEISQLVALTRPEGLSIEGQNSMAALAVMPLLIKILIAFFIFILVSAIIGSFFFSSMLVFSRNIVNNKPEKSYFKNSFRYSKYWLKLIAVKLIQGILVLCYLAILFGLILLAKKLAWLVLLLIIIFAIAGYLLYLFILPAPYGLVFYDSKILNSFKISIKQVYRNYLPFLLLNIIVDLCWLVFSIAFSLIPFVGSPLVFLLNWLFLTPFKALLFMLFMKERFEWENC